MCLYYYCTSTRQSTNVSYTTNFFHSVFSKPPMFFMHVHFSRFGNEKLATVHGGFFKYVYIYHNGFASFLHGLKMLRSNIYVFSTWTTFWNHSICLELSIRRSSYLAVFDVKSAQKWSYMFNIKVIGVSSCYISQVFKFSLKHKITRQLTYWALNRIRRSDVQRSVANCFSNSLRFACLRDVIADSEEPLPCSHKQSCKESLYSMLYMTIIIICHQSVP